MDHTATVIFHFAYTLLDWSLLTDIKTVGLCLCVRETGREREGGGEGEVLEKDEGEKQQGKEKVL